MTRRLSNGRESRPIDSGEIYVLDSLDYALKKFDARGRLMEKGRRQGQGPGEFLSPRILILRRGRLYGASTNRDPESSFSTPTCAIRERFPRNTAG